MPKDSKGTSVYITKPLDDGNAHGPNEGEVPLNAHGPASKPSRGLSRISLPLMSSASHRPNGT